MQIARTEKPKQIVVVGGGPAGLEAAWVAAARGHKVTLYEKSPSLGGQLRIAAMPPFKQDIARAISYYVYMCEKYGVSFKMETEATEERIVAQKPDAVIVASGGIPLVPEVDLTMDRGMAAAAGIVELGGQTRTRLLVAGSAMSGCAIPLSLQFDGTEGSRVVTAWEVLEGRKQAGARVLVIGGGMIGCEVADFLGEHLHRATIVEMLPSLAQDLPAAVAHFLLRRLSDYNVEIITNARIVEILEDGVTIRRNGKKTRLEGFDTLVLALGSKSVNGLAAQIEGKVPEVYVIGDAVRPRRAIEAIEEGAKIALRV